MHGKTGDQLTESFMQYTLGLLLLHILFSSCLFLLIMHFVFHGTKLHDLALNAWDSGWYETIAIRGYTHSPGEQSSVAFFSLFPLMWKLLGADRLQIALVNLLLYGTGLLLLAKKWRVRPAEFLLLVATPALFFCYVPYSEALFFLLSVLFMVGLKDQRLTLAIPALLLAGMVRSVAFVFIPVFLFMTFLQNREVPRSTNRTLNRFLLFSLVSLMSLVLTFAIHKMYTGYWFGLFETQKTWGRVFSWPHFPLRVNSTTNGFELFWLDGSAYLMGLMSGLFCLLWYIQKQQGNEVIKDDATLFSFAYLSMILLVTMLYSPVDVQGTRIYSLSRLFLCGPYYMLFILYFLRRRSTLSLFFLQIIVFIFGVLCFAYTYTESIFDLLTMVVPMFVYFCYTISGFYRLKRPFRTTLPVYATLVYLQIYLLIYFLQNNWVS